MKTRICVLLCFALVVLHTPLSGQSEKDVYRFAVENMRVMNTKFSELSLMPHSDSTYILVSDRGGMDTYDKWLGGTPYDIYIINRNDWLDIRRPDGLNTKNSDGPVSFIDPGELLVTQTNKRGVTNPKNGLNVHNLHISSAIYEDGTWNIESIPALEDKAHTFAHPSISPDGKRMFLTSNRPGGYGGNDLYVSKLEKGQWTDPVNLGPTINTDRDETFPFYHQNGILFFSSTGHKGYGGADIFMSTERGGQWSVPVNPGKPLNSSGHEYSLYLDKKMERGFVSSNRIGGRGGEDIYAVFVDKVYGVPIASGKEDVIEEAAKEVEAVQEIAEEIPVIQNMLAEEEVEDQIPEETVSKVEESGQAMNPVSQKEYATYNAEKELLGERLDAEELQNIHFGVNSFVLTNEAASQLDKVGALLLDYRRPILQLRAHTDATGDPKRNNRLSEMRARAVMQYLQYKGVDVSRMFYKAYGESELEVSSTASLAANRRVEFILEDYTRMDDSAKLVAGEGYSIKELPMLRSGSYYIQIAALSSSRTFESFRMDKYGAPTCYAHNNLYKYVIGPFEDLEAAQARRAVVRQDYKDAFIFLNK